jgi:hypothetical protein
MQPARFRKRFHSRNWKNNFPKVLLFISFPFLFLLFLLFSIARGNINTKSDKVLLAIENKEKYYLVSFDFPGKEMVVVDIPGNTEVEVARGLGRWELSSVWGLGENEKIGGGRLLSETLRNNFLAPVYLWSSEKGKYLVEGSIFSSFYFPFLERKTNLNFSDEFKLALFSARFKKSNLVRINLSDSSVLEKSRLKTGKDGYLIKGDFNQDLLWVMNDPFLSKNKVFVSLINETGSSIIVTRLGNILEAMGIKLASIENQSVSDFDCELKAKDEKIISKLSLVFSCRKNEDKNLDDGQIIIRIGKKFKERF